MKERTVTLVMASCLSITLSWLTTCWLVRGMPGEKPIEAGVSPQQPDRTGPIAELDVEKLIVRRELIVSDTGKPWEEGFERQEIPRGVYARSLGTGIAGVAVRGRLIKSEIDDPFDDRFHSINGDGSPRNAPGHISWNVWQEDAWRQVAIIQGERLEQGELGLQGEHRGGKLRFQTFRPRHDEPLTDAIITQGRMSVGGGGYGGGGLPSPTKVLELWGGEMQAQPLSPPQLPRIVAAEGSGENSYAIVALGAGGDRSQPSPAVTAQGLATLEWDSVPGADAYIVQRNGQDYSGTLWIEGALKRWRDAGQTESLAVEQ
ncbi:MAG TPA: hypothetical protein PK847_14400 [Candidatus Sumerlaeota bacterium]|nr:hypothetical protein [Candidatus Sumerlaeota bacterium]